MKILNICTYINEGVKYPNIPRVYTIELKYFDVMLILKRCEK